MFAFVSRVCDIKGLTLSYLPGVVCACVPGPPEKGKAGGRGEKNTPVNKASSGTHRVNCATLGSASKPATKHAHMVPVFWVFGAVIMKKKELLYLQ